MPYWTFQCTSWKAIQIVLDSWSYGNTARSIFIVIFKWNYAASWVSATGVSRICALSTLIHGFNRFCQEQNNKKKPPLETWEALDVKSLCPDLPWRQKISDSYWKLQVFWQFLRVEPVRKLIYYTRKLQWPWRGFGDHTHLPKHQNRLCLIICSHTRN